MSMHYVPRDVVTHPLKTRHLNYRFLHCSKGSNDCGELFLLLGDNQFPICNCLPLQRCHFSCWKVYLCSTSIPRSGHWRCTTFSHWVYWFPSCQSIYNRGMTPGCFWSTWRFWHESVIKPGLSPKQHKSVNWKHYARVRMLLALRNQNDFDGHFFIHLHTNGLHYRTYHLEVLCFTEVQM